MRHGFRNRRLQGNAGRRMRTMRNLVSSLLHHESIKTTMAKAKVTQQMVEKVITWGKRNTEQTRRKAEGFLRPPHEYTPEYIEGCRTAPPVIPLGYPNIDPTTADPENFRAPKSLLPKVFLTLAERYKDRAGGYTRIHKYGKRMGDNAPHAIVELIDGPLDVKFELVARIAGAELAQKQLGKQSSSVEGPKIVELEGGVNVWKRQLEKKTRAKVDKVLLHRSEADALLFERKVQEWADQVAVQGQVTTPKRIDPVVEELSHSEMRRVKNPFEGQRPRAGQRLPGMPVSLTGLGLARGALARQHWKKPVLDKTPRYLLEASSVKPASTKDI